METNAMDKDGLNYREINETYYFETDHVALKENPDYHNVLHTIALLEAQRQQAARDIDTLYKAQSDALSDPLTFVEKLQRGKKLDLPKQQKIAALPEIDWDKYSSNLNFTALGSSQHMTRNKKVTNDSGTENSVNIQKPNVAQTLQANSTSNTDGGGSLDSNVVVVRGRTKDNSKPATFNQLWTEEEQQRLEQLLIRFPPEEIESRRWSKIADALGNRTPVQVASRVQKYFLRLAKEGLPIPGRMPNLSTYTKRMAHRHHRYNRHYYPSTTFLQSHVPPVLMREEEYGQSCSSISLPGLRSESFPSGDNTPAMSESTSTKDESSDDDDDIPSELANTPEYQELQRLKKLKRRLVAQQQMSATKHIGYKCDKCGCEPIVGTRWHCIDCPAEFSFDFCDACSVMSFQKEQHNSSHRLHPFRHAVLDSDYVSSSAQDYNYLDPNYMPAS